MILKWSIRFWTSYWLCIS